MSVIVTEIPPAERPKRRRNPRGQGERLKDEIISAATSLLEQSGTEYTLTLRAIAREVGVAAPSVARHFSDVMEIIDAVAAREATALGQILTAAAASATAPVERLFAICRAYVDYGRANPARYRVIVGRHFLDDWQAQHRAMELTAPVLAANLAIVVETVQACIDTGASAGTDAFFDTAMLWFALHGFLTVTAAFTSIDWPEQEELLVACVTRAVGLTGDTHRPPGEAKRTDPSNPALRPRRRPPKK